MKLKFRAFLSLIFILIALPTTFSIVYAQNNDYTIDQVDHQIQVLYSGHIAIIDTIHVSGEIADGFQIGLPRQYSAQILEGFAYDQNNQYQLNLGVPLGNQTAFYGAEVVFNGQTPSVFDVAFVLSNKLITEQENGTLTLNYPAYPGFTREVEICNVNLLFPSSPIQLSISKEDGNENQGNYVKSNLQAFTYSVGLANFKVPTGTLQLTTISSLTRQVNINPTGSVSTVDTYRISNDADSMTGAFVLSLPIEAQNIIVSDGAGKTLSYLKAPTASGNMQLVNVTLSTFLLGNQSTTLAARYELPSASIQNAIYVLSNFQLFPDVSYYVNQATVIFTPPEGATIVTPKASELSVTSTLTRTTYQDTLSITENGLSDVNYLLPQQHKIQLAYEYNPVWVSLRPTFWGALVALLACIGALIYRKRNPKEITYADRVEELSNQKESQPATATEKPSERKIGQSISKVDIKAFLDAYEDKKQLTDELKSMDQRAQKGKIPRRQYKVQRRAIEIRLEGINRNIRHLKTKFHHSTGIYLDLVRQIDLAEEDLTEAEENIQTLQKHQSRSEISLETYKNSIGNYQKQRDKAESAINGILLRLREKIR